jgi:hypothetical protein
MTRKGKESKNLSTERKGKKAEGEMKALEDIILNIPCFLVRYWVRDLFSAIFLIASRRLYYVKASSLWTRKVALLLLPHTKLEH